MKDDNNPCMEDGTFPGTISWTKPKYDVMVTEDVVYGHALRHEYWGSDIEEEASKIDLLLDLYQPMVDEEVNRSHADSSSSEEDKNEDTIIIHEDDANEDNKSNFEHITTDAHESIAIPLKNPSLRRRKCNPSNNKINIHPGSSNHPDGKRRLAIMLFHGGAFHAGDKSGQCISRLANKFASRGFVTFVPNYRLARHRGTIPWLLKLLAIPLILPELVKRRRGVFGTQIFLWFYQITIISTVITTYLDLFDAVTNKIPMKYVISYINRVFAVYPAGRDGKAALRWIYANADKYNIDKDHITVYGESAGGMIAVMLGVSSPEDYCNEISTKEDPTLLSTNHYINYHQEKAFLSLLPGDDSQNNYSSEAKDTTAVCRVPRYVINNAGGPLLLQALRFVFCKPSRYNNETNARICTIHHTLDCTTPFHQAMELYRAYRQVEGSVHQMHIIHGRGHVVQDSQHVNGKTLTDIILSFIKTNMMKYVSGEIP